LSPVYVTREIFLLKIPLECSKTRDDLFGAVYWGVRAYCCQDYYPMNEQLLKYLEEARLAYLEMLEREWLDVLIF